MNRTDLIWIYLFKHFFRKWTSKFIHANGKITEVLIMNLFIARNLFSMKYSFTLCINTMSVRIHTETMMNNTRTKISYQVLLKHRRVIVETWIFLKGENCSETVESWIGGFRTKEKDFVYSWIFEKPQQIMGFEITHLDWCGLKQDIKTNVNGYIFLAYLKFSVNSSLYHQSWVLLRIVKLWFELRENNWNKPKFPRGY